MDAGEGNGALTRRLVDILLACTALLLSSPLFLAASLAVLIGNPGPVFYRAPRVGLHGKVFTMVKLRTMYVRSGDGGSVITAAEDVRVFPAGRWLRRLRLDELPQLLNILRGDMSFVGPRARDPKVVERYTDLHRETLNVLPGLTSPGTLYYLSHAEQTLVTDDPEREYHDRILPVKLALDIEYVRSRTLLTDIGVALRALATVLRIRRPGFDPADLDKVRPFIQPMRTASA
ncbi:MAG: sugar transferase [Pseudomonadales bacterium]|nr:sugar transferase [Pseudomonadales bacterium]